MRRLLMASLVLALAAPAGAEAQISDGGIYQLTYRGHSGWHRVDGRRLALPFYDFSITGVGAPGGGYWDMLCIDPTDYVNNGAYGALATEVVAGNSFGGTRLGSPDGDDLGDFALNNYLITAYLYDQAEVAYAAGDRDRLHALQRAAWYATAGDDPGMYGWGEGMGLANAEFTAAESAVAGGWSASGFYVMTAINSDGSLGSGQEFLMRVGVPEPGTLALFGSGLLGLMGVGARRRLSASPDELA